MNRCDRKRSNYVHSPPVSPPGSGSEQGGTHGQSYMITAKASKLSLVPSPLLVVGTAHQKWAGNQTKHASHNSVVVYTSMQTVCLTTHKYFLNRDFHRLWN